MTKTKQRLKTFTPGDVDQLSQELEDIAGDMKAFRDKLAGGFNGVISVDGGDMAWDALRLLTKWLSRADEDYKIQRLPGPKPVNGTAEQPAKRTRIRRGE